MKRIEGMSYSELAELCEIERSTLSEFINGKDSRIKTVLKISIGTGINI
jgi:predicted transcriptional regulator